MGWRVITADGAMDYDDGIEAAIRHCKNVALNVGSLIMRTFDDTLPMEERLRKPEVIDNYVEVERPGSRHTWTLGQPEPAFPREEEQQAPILHAAEWRTRAFYYALGQVESMWELSPLVEGDAVSFSYHFQGEVRGGGLGVVTNITLRESWVQWEAARRASLEQHGRPEVAAIRLPRGPGVDYLEGGEHDPNLGPDLR